MARPIVPAGSLVSKSGVKKRPTVTERLRRAETQKKDPPASAADNGLAAESRISPAAGRKQPVERDTQPPADRRSAADKRRGFTLIEILVAMAVTLILLGIVVSIFGLIGDNVSSSRSAMEMNDQLRSTKNKLQLDLAGVTVRMLPPMRPVNGDGYFEAIEGPVGRLPPNTKFVLDELGNLNPDTTVGDNDDILMFTTRSRAEPFVGRHPTLTSLQSQVAEVAWFVRGTTLYRRQLLIRPDLNQPGGLVPVGLFYSQYDLSVHAEGGNYDLSPSPPSYQVVANSLSDLTKRENRFCHRPLMSSVGSPYGWPHDVRGWGVFYSTTPYGYSSLGSAKIPTVGRLGLPTLRECSSPSWYLPGTVDLIDGVNRQQIALTDPSGNGVSSNKQGAEQFDAWNSPNPWNTLIPAASSSPTAGVMDAATGTLNYYPNGTRLGEDIILTNVLSFDVRVWDSTAWLIGLTDSTGITQVFAPGDAGYARAVIYFVQNYSTYTYTLISQGAYVDLNYYSSVVAYAVQNSIDLTSLNTTQQSRLTTLFPCPLSSPGSNFFLYGSPSPSNSFYGPGNGFSGLDAFLRDTTLVYVPDNNGNRIIGPAVYDTGSFHYEQDGINQDGTAFVDTSGNPIVDQGTDGIDNNGDGLVDDDAELEAPPPYTTPLRGIQVKIRCFEPDSRQIREVTVVQDFVPG